MAIKSFFFGHKRRFDQRAVEKFVSILLLSAFITGCASMKPINKTSQVPATSKQVKNVPSVNSEPVNTTPIPLDVSQPIVEPQIETEKVEVAPVQQSLTKESIKIGLILGPGGLKAYAHMGVLEEIEKAHIPIHAVVGLEWGSLIGGIYAMKGQAFDAQWQMQKLKKEDLPDRGLLAQFTNSDSVDKLNPFLTSVFENKRIEDSQLAFACPIMPVAEDDIQWNARGSLADRVKSCMAFPPLFKPYQKRVAAAFAVSDAAEHLREAGANLIILVDVLGDGEIFNSRTDSDYMAQIIWATGKQNMRRQRTFVDEVFAVQTKGFGLSAYDSRQELIFRGNETGRQVVKTLISKYGF